jgi:hypothetical protein
MSNEQVAEVLYLWAAFEGRMPDGTMVGYAISAGIDTTPEALEETSGLGVRGLEMKHPGVQGASQVTPWREAVMELTDDETTEEA